MPHPGCACTTCYDGGDHGDLTRHQLDRIERALTRAGHPRPVRLRVVTPAPALDDAVPQPTGGCDATMTCECDRCTTQRAALVQAGPRTDQSDPFRKAA